MLPTRELALHLAAQGGGRRRLRVPEVPCPLCSRWHLTSTAPTRARR